MGRQRENTMPPPEMSAVPPELADEPGQPGDLPTRKLVINFMTMAVCFSVNHATVTALVGLATNSLDVPLGNLQLALLYSFYTITALLAAKPIVSITGNKWGIVAGLSLYIVYVASFIVTDKVPSIKRFAACFGGSVGGVAAGFLWTAQYGYFLANAAAYAESRREFLSRDLPADVTDEVKVTEHIRGRAQNIMAAWFAIPYLSFEVIFKLMQSYIGLDTGPVSAHWSEGKDFIYVINTICAVAAALGCATIMDLPDAPPVGKPAGGEASQPAVQPTIIDRMLSAAKLFVADPKMPLMMGINVCFGIAASYMNGYVTGPVVKMYIGGGYGGYLAAITAAVAALISLPNTLKLIPESSK